MKHYFLFLNILILSFISCKKSESINRIEPDLAGSWRMVSVKEISTGSTIRKPSSINGEVDSHPDPVRFPLRKKQHSAWHQ